MAASPIEPFFGSGTDYQARLVNESLACQGSTLRSELIRRGEWPSVWLIAGTRRCRLSGHIVECFVGEQEEVIVECANVDDVVALTILFLERGVDADELAADPRALR